MGGGIKNILITGATGYLGARLSIYLAKKGYNITALCRAKPMQNTSWAKMMNKIVIGDIRDSATIDRIGEDQFNSIVHLVSLNHDQSKGDLNFVSSVNVLPSWTLLDKYTKIGLEKFINISSVQVYGNTRRKKINENSHPYPINEYGLTHLLSENICSFFDKTTATHCINVRVSNSYGSPIFNENNCWSLVINDLCKNIYEKKLIKLKSDGSPQKDFIHGDDVIRGIDFLLSYNKKLKNSLYNIASGQTLTVLELALKVKEVYFKRYGRDADILLPDDSIATNKSKIKKINKNQISIERLKRIGWSPEVSCEDGINELFKYLEN